MEAVIGLSAIGAVMAAAYWLRGRGVRQRIGVLNATRTATDRELLALPQRVLADRQKQLYRLAVMDTGVKADEAVSARSQSRRLNGLLKQDFGWTETQLERENLARLPTKDLIRLARHLSRAISRYGDAKERIEVIRFQMQILRVLENRDETILFSEQLPALPDHSDPRDV